jgi:hypothetical protein
VDEATWCFVLADFLVACAETCGIHHRIPHTNIHDITHFIRFIQAPAARISLSRALPLDAPEQPAAN